MTVLALLSLLALAGDPVELRTAISPERDAWVGERVRLYVTVVMASRPASSPRFDLPRVDGALLRQSPGSPVLGSEQVDGVEVTTQRFELLLFPQRPGAIEIPPVGVRVDLGDGELSVATPALAARAALPPGVEPGTSLVTSSELSVDERFEPSFDAEGRLELTVGDALTRTITLEAKDLLGLALPPAPVPELEGLAAYPEGPTVDDRLVRGALAATRSDRVTFVCSRAGTYRFPALRYAWWNPGAGRLERVTLPARTLVVAPGPDTPAAADVEATGRPPLARSTRLALGAAAALLALAAALLWRTRARWRGDLQRRREARSRTEPALHAALERACAQGDAAAAWSALLPWTRTLRRDAAWDSIDEAAQALGAAALLRESALLQHALLDGSPWSGADLRAAAAELRGERPARAGDAAALPALNPPPRGR